MTLLTAEIPEAGYGKKIVLKNVGISAGKGEIVALIGPNGAGKSTLLKVLVGMVRIAQGSVNFGGADITNRSPEENARAGISFVPQGNRVFTELSVKENLEIGGYLLDGRASVTARLSEVVSVFPDLRERLHQNAGQLSGGEKQQLALARALMLKPRVLLLDEPSLGLSPKLVTKAFETIRGVNEKYGITVLLVEQKVREVLHFGHRVYALRMGQLVFSGTPAELQDSEAMRKIFLV